MEITSIGYSPRPADLIRQRPAGPQGPQGGGFGDMLSAALLENNSLQTRADDLAGRVVMGQSVDVHDAVLAAEEANLAFQYTLQVRNKLIEAYQEVMSMQV